MTIEEKAAAYDEMIAREKARARSKARATISTDGATCEQCGSTERLERHHEDHSKPLEVQILCRKCHQKITPKPGRPRRDDSYRVRVQTRITDATWSRLESAAASLKMSVSDVIRMLIETGLEDVRG